MLERLLQSGHRVYVLVRDRHIQAAEKDIQHLLTSTQSGECVILEGDITKLDLGLSGQEIRHVIDEVDVIHHMAEMFHLGGEPSHDSQRKRGGNEEDPGYRGGNEFLCVGYAITAALR